MRPTVVLIDPMYDPAAPALLAEHATVRTVSSSDAAELADALAGAHGVVVRYPARIDAAVLAQAPNLLVVLSSGRGVDNIDLAAAGRAGVVVANNPGLGGPPVSEHALGLLLMVTRDLTAVARHGIEGAWERRLSTHRVELNGGTLGIVGCGNVGGWVARRASAGFGMRVLAYDPYVSAEQIAAVGAVKVDDFGSLLAQSDFVTAHPELNDETARMFDDKAFELMRPGSYFVNTSRGGVLDTEALVRALRSGHLAGAALDVYQEEPLPVDSPLLTMDNVVLSAHVADFTVQTKRKLAMSAAEQVLAALRGECPAHALNPEVWPTVARRAGQVLA